MSGSNASERSRSRRSRLCGPPGEDRRPRHHAVDTKNQFPRGIVVGEARWPGGAAFAGYLSRLRHPRGSSSEASPRAAVSGKFFRRIRLSRNHCCWWRIAVAAVTNRRDWTDCARRPPRNRWYCRPEVETAAENRVGQTQCCPGRVASDARSAGRPKARHCGRRPPAYPSKDRQYRRHC